MADQARIADALQAILQVLQVLQNQVPPAPPAPPPPHVHVAVHELFDATTPFDLSTRSGSSAYAKASSPLTEKWDGSIDKFPNFIVALMSRASESKWDATAPHGILTYVITGVNKNILTEHHSIPLTDIEAARTTRLDPRAIQNARCFYFCIKDTLEGDIRDIVYAQLDNLPDQEDGATLLKTITGFSMASSLQLTIQTIRNIQALEPSDFDYKVSAINTKLTHLFMLAASVNRQLTSEEKIQHTLTIYSKIKQPEAWAQWVRNKVDAFDEATLTSCQTLMNQGALKLMKIESESGEFRGRSTTLQEDVVAMMATKAKRPPTRPPRLDKSTDNPGKGKSTLPPFVRHFKSADTPNATKFKVGDTKDFEGATWYFCGCPKHRDGLKWHTHTVETCRVRIKWLADQDGAANVGASETNTDGTDTEVSSLSTPEIDPTALLASAFSAVGSNSVAQALIADALAALADG